MGISLPQSDLKDTVNNKSAFTYGIRLDIPITPALALRPRVDFASYSGDYAQMEAIFPGHSITSQVKTFWAGVELLAGPGAVNTDGIYCGVGLGLQNMSLKVNLPQYGTTPINTSASTPGASSLLGYQFNENFGCEARYWYSNPSLTIDGMHANFGNRAIALDLTLRF